MRLVEVSIVGLWLISMTWLVARDVVPRWFAEAPPPSATVSWLNEHGKTFQYELSGEDVSGRAWTLYELSGDHQITRTDMLSIGPLGIMGELLVSCEMVFLHETELDTVELRLWSGPLQVTFRGERQGPQFAFRMKLGTLPDQDFILDAAAAQTLSDTIKPFSALRDLSVGQSWQIHVIDPFSLFQQSKARVTSVWATVTRREVLEHRGRMCDCFVVEAANTRAWVDAAGRPLLQIVEVPALGQLRIREAPFEEAALEQMRRRIRNVKRDSGHPY